MSASPLKTARPLLILIVSSIALTASVGLAFVGYQAARLQVENALLHQQLLLTDLQIRSQQTQLQSEQIITQAQLRNATNISGLQIHLLHPRSDALSGTTSCVIWLPAQGTGFIFAENLPDLSDGQEYRVWLTQESTNEPLNCGAFQSRDATAVSPFQFNLPPDFSADIFSPQFGVSIEAIGSTTPPKLMLFSSH